MTAETNRQWRLRSRPAGMPEPANFDLARTPMPSPGPGEALVRVHYWSLDPYMRGRMRDAKSYAPPVGLGDVMVGAAVGEVIRSEDPTLAVGTMVEGPVGWQEYGVLGAGELRRIEPRRAPISTALGLLGMPGRTAYFGLLDIGRPKPGETVVVSAAAGAVGSIVGQIAKIKGCRIVGIVGSDEKADMITDEYGFDAAVNYRATSDLGRSLADACPTGVDIYFDNVGGAVTDAALPLINIGARIPVCGQISQYNLDKPETGPRLTWLLLVNRALMKGFIVFDFADRYGEADNELMAWFEAGRLAYREDVIDGFERMPEAFIRLMTGSNVGKQLVRAAIAVEATK